MNIILEKLKNLDRGYGVPYYLVAFLPPLIWSSVAIPLFVKFDDSSTESLAFMDYIGVVVFAPIFETILLIILVKILILFRFRNDILSSAFVAGFFSYFHFNIFWLSGVNSLYSFFIMTLSYKLNPKKKMVIMMTLAHSFNNFISVLPLIFL